MGMYARVITILCISLLCSACSSYEERKKRAEEYLDAAGTSAVELFDDTRNAAEDAYEWGTQTVEEGQRLYDRAVETVEETQEAVQTLQESIETAKEGLESLQKVQGLFGTVETHQEVDVQ